VGAPAVLRAMKGGITDDGTVVLRQQREDPLVVEVSDEPVHHLRARDVVLEELAILLRQCAEELQQPSPSAAVMGRSRTVRPSRSVTSTGTLERHRSPFPPPRMGHCARAGGIDVTLQPLQPVRGRSRTRA